MEELSKTLEYLLQKGLISKPQQDPVNPMNTGVPALDEILSSYKSLEDYANQICKNTQFLPDYLHQDPSTVLFLMQYGLNLGMMPQEALLSLIPKKGYVTMFGDAVKSRIIRSGKVDQWEEKETGTIEGGDYAYTITTTRKDPKISKTISRDLEWFKRAGLFVSKEAFKLIDPKKDEGAWIRHNYPDRSIQYIVLGFISRDVYPEVVKNLRVYEEVLNYKTRPQHTGTDKDFEQTDVRDTQVDIDKSAKASEKVVEKSKGVTSINEEISSDIDTNPTSQRDELLQQEQKSRVEVPNEDFDQEAYQIDDDSNETKKIYTDAQLKKMSGVKFSEIQDVAKELFIFPELLPGRNTNRKLRKLILAHQEGPEEYKKYIKEVWSQREWQKYCRARTVEISKDENHYLSTKDGMAITKSKNPYKIPVPELNDRGHRDIDDAKKLMEDINKLVFPMDSSNEDFIKSIEGVADPEKFVSMDEFIRFAPVSTINAWLKKNY